MNDKSPRQQLSKKSSKSLKQKRADKRADAANAPRETPRRKRLKG
ncbi:hypothetical protein [Nocardioides humi]|uniref:Uncharacterized protein n=1 Tax=Nocardioides humi TaxID=449461 RepID=A0ABN2B1K1_9ACTN|nr:hypothetical protein [Nocardioides humi]